MKSDIKIEGVVLAAGKSERFGRWKPGVEIGGRKLIELAILPMLEFSGRVIVVGGYNFEKLKEILDGQKGVQIVYNENYEKGMFSSVKKGVLYVTQDVDAFFILPGDYPMIKESTYRKLLKYRMFEVVSPSYYGKKGHPVLLNGRLREPLLRESEDLNLREFLRKWHNIIVEVEDPGILKDVDLPEDYERIKDFRANK